MRYRIFLLVIIVISFPSHAQEMFGIVNSNFAGVNGLEINPANTINSKVYLDVNIISLGAFLENNYLYIHKEDYSFLEFLKKNPTLPEYGKDSLPFDHYWEKGREYVYQNLKFIGPSAMMINGDHAFGIHSAVRAISAIWRIPYHLANFMYEDLSFKDQHNINYIDNNYSFSNLVWMEVGAFYSTILRQYNRNRWSAGVSINRLFAYTGSYMYVNSLDYIVLNDSTADIPNLNGETGFSLPIDYDNNDYINDQGLFRGGGFSTNIGISFQRMKKVYRKSRYKKLCHQNYKDYIYRIGVSIIDLGYINFKKNAQQHDFTDVNHYWENINQTEFTSINQFFRELSGRFYNGDSTRSLVADKFTMYLPTALSAQIDYHYRDNWYFSSMALIPVMYSVAQIYRPPQVMISVRYETENSRLSQPMFFFRLKHFPLLKFSLNEA